MPQGYAQNQLTSTNSKSGIAELLAYVIFESTVNIFSIGLPGADILIPAYLVEISAMVCSLIMHELLYLLYIILLLLLLLLYYIIILLLIFLV
jgi:hypothetical protein